MNEMPRKKKLLYFLNKRTAYHYYFWGLVFAGFFVLMRMMSSTGYSLGFASLYSLLQALPVYCHFFILKKFFNEKKYLPYVFTALGILIFSGSLNFFLLRVIFNDKNKFLAYYIHVLIFLIVTTALKFLKNDLRQTLRSHERETRQLEAEMNTIKKKISPGFVLQELSVLHALSMNKSEKIPASILRLSEYMRQLLKRPKPQSFESSDHSPGENLKTPGILNTRLFWYIYTWIFLFSLIFFPWGETAVFARDRVYDFCYFFALTLPTYPHFFFLEKWFKKRFSQYVVATGILICGTAGLYATIFSSLFEHKAFFFQWVLELVFAIVIATAIKTVKDGFKQRVRLQEIKARHLRSELNLLKSQVNPHFFFNTLNNLYSLSLDSSEKLPEMTRKFRDLMAYMLEISKEETVALAQEWEFLENYISLERLRLREDCSIKIDVTGDLPGKKIPPMLLIPFVENSFKHGVGAAGDFFVFIELKVTNEKLAFTVENNLPQIRGTGNVAPATKSGLKNVKRRLELLYPQGHRLGITEKDNTFRVSLEVTL